jgi:prolyl oligopeptidase
MADGAVRSAGEAHLPWRPDDFITEQVFVTADDGTRVPLFLSHRRDTTPTGDVPTLLYGYGGFQIAVGPMFKPEWLAWMERGGLLAVASLRGGAEYGRDWHDAGRLANKQNVFDDFAASARWLAASGWTRAERIGISGRSNGGLLVGASITQHPELFGAAVAEVGVMDMLRFHRFTIGWGWTSDYGSADDPEQYRWLRAYSPLHNIRDGAVYPPTLVTTGDHDDRVVPGHSFKFAAALQAAQGGDAPIVIRVDTDAGHGMGKPVRKLVEERSDVLAFLEYALGPLTSP